MAVSSGGPETRLPPEFFEALDQLNSGEYFECHETLEALWLAEPSALRLLYQGVLQIAVGCFHLVTRANYRGAVKKLDQGSRKLEEFLPLYGRFNTAELLEQADMLRRRLEKLGEANVSSYDPAWLPRISKTGD